MVVFTSLDVIKCTPLIKFQIKYTLFIHKVVCMVQPNQFNQEIYTVIKVRVTEAEAWLCFPGTVSQHRSGLQKIQVLSHGLSRSADSSLSCCMEWLPFCVACSAESPSGKFAEQLSCNWWFLQVFWIFVTQHLLYQCWFERQQHDAVLWHFRIRLLEKQTLSFS